MRTFLSILLVMAVIAGFALVPALARGTDLDLTPPAPTKPDKGNKNKKPNPAPPVAEDSVLTPELKAKFDGLKARIAALEGELTTLKALMAKGLEEHADYIEENLAKVEAAHADAKVKVPQFLEEARVAHNNWSDGEIGRVGRALAAFKRELGLPE